MLTRRRMWLVVFGMALATAMVVSAGAAQAAEVTGLSAKKQLVKIDAGTGAGFNKDANVCFYDGSKKVTCGVVQKASSKEAIVSVTKGFKSIKKGMTVKPAETSEVVEPAGAKPAVKFKGKGIWLLGFSKEPVVYNLVAWKPFPAGSTATHIPGWTGVPSSGVKFMNFGASGEYDLSKKLAAAVGFRMTMMSTTKTDYDLITGDYTQYVHVEQTASSMGFWGDVYFMNVSLGPIALRAASGLDFDMSTVGLKVSQVTESTKASSDIATVTSKVNVISLRLLPEAELVLKPLVISFTPVIFIPLFAMGGSFAADFPQATAADNSATWSEDAKAALGHRKAGFGMHLMMSAGMAF